MRKYRGWIRLGIVLSVAWVAAVLSFATYDFLAFSQESRNAFVREEFLTPNNRYRSLVPRRSVFTECARETGCRPRIGGLATAALAPLAAAWILLPLAIVASNWVRAGFADDPIHEAPAAATPSDSQGQSDNGDAAGSAPGQRGPYLALLALILIAHMWAAAALVQGSLIWNVLPAGLGGALGAITFAYVLIYIPLKLFRRKHPPNQLAVVAVGGAILSVIAIYGQFTAANLERGGRKASYESRPAIAHESASGGAPGERFPERPLE